MVAVSDIAMAMATSTQAVLRANFLQHCNKPEFAVRACTSW
jgi:hypothetical protein